jgi:hypothetical protein
LISFKSKTLDAGGFFALLETGVPAAFAIHRWPPPLALPTCMGPIGASSSFSKFLYLSEAPEGRGFNPAARVSTFQPSPFGHRR